MTLKQTQAALRSGALVLAPAGKVEARSEFQRKRLTEAVTAASMFLGGKKAVQIAFALDVHPERAAQIIRLGIKHMFEIGWLRPGDEVVTPKP